MSAAMKILAIALVALQGYQAAAEKKPVVLLSESAAGPGPLTKVINLLKDMQKELAAEAKEDKKMHDQVACWCKTNKEGKTQQVEDAKKKDDQLVSDIQLHAATTSGLQVDLEDLKKDIAADEKALAEAVALRLKEGNTFHQGETDLIQAIESLKGAITTLSKHHDAMLQTDLDKDPLIVSMKPNLRRLIHRHRENLAFLLPEAKKDLEGFLNAQSYVFDSDPSLVQISALRKRAPGNFKSHAPQSGAILGILKQMLEAFTGDRKENQDEEMSKIEAYTTMKSAKEEEITQQKTSVETKTGELATAKENLVNAKGDLEDTRAAMSADMKFLLEVEEKCTKSEFEWEERLKTRTEEQVAISEAIAIMDTDEARDAQRGTFGFLQVSQTQTKVVRKDTAKQMRAHAALVLKARLSSSPRLRSLLSALQLDSFVKVKAFIDQLVTDLTREQADEVAQRDSCIKNIAENERDTDKKTWDQKNLEAKIAELEQSAKTIAEELATLNAEIADLQVELQRAGDARKAENAEFQQTASDQHLVQAVLAKALVTLKKFYSKKHSLIQNKKSPDVAAPGEKGAAMPKQKAYKKNSKSTGIMGIMQELQGEAQRLETMATADEQNAQESYQKLVGETNDSVRAKSRAVTDKTEEKAKVDQEIDQAKQDFDQVNKDLFALNEELGSLHKECDFILKNFEARQTARSAEMDALREVKAILSGMK